MSESKYAVLAAELREKILSGIYAPGTRVPSENELAAQTGYSRQTVRQAMSVLEHEGLTDRVRGSGTFVRQEFSSRPETRNIAVVTTYIGEYIFPDILRGIDDVLVQNGYTSMLSATRNRVDSERRILADLLQKPIDGMIVEGTKTALPNPNIDLYDEFARAGIPIVFINGYYPDLKNPVYVVADDRSGGAMAVKKLLAHGHTRIAGFFKNDDIQGHRRYAGFTQALRDAGLSMADDHVLWFTTENRDSLLSSCAAQTVSGCTAAVCYNDEVALGLLGGPGRPGIPLPKDFELVSFDNSTYVHLAARPFLSLSTPKEQLGSLAAEKLLELLHHRPCASAVLPWTLEET